VSGAATGEKPRIAIVGDRRQISSETARRLAPLTVALVDVTSSSSQVAFGALCDILVVGLSGSSLAPLEWSLARWSALGGPELVILSGDLVTDPLARGLGAAGVRYVLAEQTAADWLLEHAPALSEYSRARRALAEATSRLPGPPRPSAPGPASETLGLFQAEQSFRATYIKTLLARSSSRREAALKARVAYRTFCHMLEKLGISSRKIQRQRMAFQNDPLLSLTDNDCAHQHGARESRPIERRRESKRET
jgi:hypothetical protein